MGINFDGLNGFIKSLTDSWLALENFAMEKITWLQGIFDKYSSILDFINNF